MISIVLVENYYDLELLGKLIGKLSEPWSELGNFASRVAPNGAFPGCVGQTTDKPRAAGFWGNGTRLE
jgi:hypothetical protein